MIAGLKPYPEVKDSGVPWIGVVPQHWERRRLKTLLRVIDRRSATGTETLLSLRREHGIVPYADHFSRPSQGETTVGYKIVAKGQLVLNRLQANNGLVFDSTLEGLVSPDYSVFEARGTNVVMRFLSQLLRTTPYRDHFRREATGLGTGSAGFLRLYDDRFLETVVMLPAREEQLAILRFLAFAEHKILRYVRIKRRLAQILEEQKRGIIHRALTRGIDPNACLRPSGAEWLGNVPRHWKVKRLKWALRLQRGYDLPADSRIIGPYPVVSSGGAIGFHSEYRCEGPGVLMGRYGSTDAVFFVTENFWPHNTALFVTDFQGNDPKWCYFLLRTISKSPHSGKSAVPGVDR
jgi:type I restriction enzyme S subunit